MDALGDRGAARRLPLSGLLSRCVKVEGPGGKLEVDKADAGIAAV